MEKPMSWSATGSSALKLNIRHLCFFGTWALFESRAYHAYSAFIFVLVAWNTVENVLAVWFSFGNLEETSMTLVFSITNCCGVLKMALLIRDRHSYYNLARTVDALTVSVGKDPAFAGLIEEHQRRGAHLTRGMLLFMILQAVLWFPLPLYVHPEERRLPFAQHGWDNNRHYYGLSYALQCLSSLCIAQNTFGVDCLFATIMILITAQLKTLTLSTKGITLLTRPSDEKKSSFPSGKLVCKDYDYMYRDLCQKIIRHQNVLSCIKDLQTVMSPAALTQFAGSVLVLCVSLFQATCSNNISDVSRGVAFIPIPSGQVFLYCWTAHNISEEAETMATAAYSCSWVEADQRFRRTLRIVISRAMKPLVLTAGRIYPIDRPSFLSMVNASYSFYALLSQMNRR